MKDLAQSAVEEARRAGAVYADARVLERSEERIEVRNGRVFCDLREERGLAVRARVRGGWGFAATASLDAGDVRRAAQEAAAAAHAAALFAAGAGNLAGGPRGPARFETRVERDPFAVPLAEKVALAMSAEAAARRAPSVRMARCRLRFLRDRMVIATSEGSASERILHLAGAGVRVVAAADGRVEVRTVPAGGGGVWAGGYEVVLRLGLSDLAARAGEEASALLAAPLCPEGVRDVVLDPWIAARLLHETLGHALEADVPSSVRGAKEPVGSRVLTLFQDPAVDGAPGTIGVDDEGIAPQALTLIHEGAPTAALTDRERAASLGVRSAGAARAEDFRVPPTVRMTNLAVAPGRGDLEAMLADLDGLYLAGARGYSVDAARATFRLSAEIAWEVKKGKRGRPLRGAALCGLVSEVWRALEAVGGAESMAVAGLWCDKGSPPQRVAVGHRLGPVRLRKVAVLPAGR